MTPDLQSLSSLTDAEFLSRPEVRSVYWKCLGVEVWGHAWTYEGDGTNNLRCSKCGVKTRGLTVPSQGDCLVPDPIPGSLADAVERLRVKVWEKFYVNEPDGFEAWKHVVNIYTSPEFRPNPDQCPRFDVYYVYHSPRQRFLVFAAVLSFREPITQSCGAGCDDCRPTRCVNGIRPQA